MFTPYRVSFAPARKPYQIGLLFTHKNGVVGSIFVTERSCDEPTSKVRSHISDNVFTLYHTAIDVGTKRYPVLLYIVVTICLLIG